MKTIKYYITILVIVFFTNNLISQIKVVVGGDVGIGTNQPTKKLEVFGNQIISGVGNKLFFGDDNKYLGFPSSTGDLSLITKDGNWMRIGSSGGIGFWGGVGAESNSPTHQMFLNNIGLGIGSGGQAWGTYKLVVYGDAIISGSYFFSSDEQFKKNIAPIDDALNKILKLKGKEYSFRKDEFTKYDFNSSKQIGFIAQELKEVLPELVIKDKDGYYGVNYISIIPVLVEAIKEQQIQIEKLKNYLDDNNRVLTNNIDVLPTVILHQNAPNPFTEKTVIKYVIPENVQKASILIFNMQGTLLKTYDNLLSNNGELIINGGELEAGMYMYSLIVEGKEIDTKKMILSK